MSTPQKDELYKHFEMSRVWYGLSLVLLFKVISLINKLDYVITTINTTSVDAAAITETWQKALETCNITGYHLFHSLRIVNVVEIECYTVALTFNLPSFLWTLLRVWEHPITLLLRCLNRFLPGLPPS